MSDTLTQEQRSRCMAAIRSKDTKPELVVRRVLTALGYRYRLHRRDLPGRPDVVLRPAKVVIFVHGCFWHRHTCKLGRPEPKTRAAFWKAKFTANVARDRRTRAALRKDGWCVITVWECQTREPEKLARRLTVVLAKRKS